MLKVYGLLVAVMMAGCSGVDIKPADTNPTDMKPGPGLFSGKSGNLLDSFRGTTDGGLLGGSGGAAAMAVNPYLWRASLESVGFMPLATADSNGGTIITDWYSAPQTPNERVKVNILIVSKDLRADGIQAKIFKQTKQKNGDWSSSEADAATSRQLEDIILTKARAMRVEALKK